jgi:hypothetical protein
LTFLRLFSEEMAVNVIGTARNSKSSLLSTKLILGFTDLKEERREKRQYARRGQKKDGNRGQLFCLICRNSQQKKARDRKIWISEIETIEKSRYRRRKNSKRDDESLGRLDKCVFIGFKDIYSKKMSPLSNFCPDYSCPIQKREAGGIDLLGRDRSHAPIITRDTMPLIARPAFPFLFDDRGFCLPRSVVGREVGAK